VGRTVYRLLLAAVALLLLAIPALGQTRGVEMAKLDIHPETVLVGDDDTRNIYFDATVNNLKPTAKVYLTFRKENSNTALQVELKHDDGLWTGKKTVDGNNAGTWNLVYCTYQVDGETGVLDFDEDNTAIEKRFTVQKEAAPDLVELDIHPETVTVAAGSGKDIYFDAAVDDLDTDATVFLVFRKEGSTSELKAELAYEDGVWTGKKTVNDGDAGTWKLVDCSYKLGEETGSIAFDTGDADIDLKFTVKKMAVTPPAKDKDKDGDKAPAPRICKPKQLRAVAGYDEDGKTKQVTLTWRPWNENSASKFTVYAGYDARHMVRVATVEGRNNCTLNLDEVLKALEEQKKPKGRKHVLFRVGNNAGFSNVAVVHLAQYKVKAGKEHGKWNAREHPTAKVKWDACKHPQAKVKRDK